MTNTPSGLPAQVLIRGGRTHPILIAKASPPKVAVCSEQDARLVGGLDIAAFLDAADWGLFLVPDSQGNIPVMATARRGGPL